MGIVLVCEEMGKAEGPFMVALMIGVVLLRRWHYARAQGPVRRGSDATIMSDMKRPREGSCLAESCGRLGAIGRHGGEECENGACVLAHERNQRRSGSDC